MAAMEKAKESSNRVKDSLEVEPDDSQTSECSQLHMNVLAMLALKFMFEENVTDLSMRRVKTVGGANQSPVDNVVFTFKRCEGGEKSEQWSCLIVPSQSHEVSLESTSKVANQSLCNDFMEYYKIYWSLKEDPDQDINLEDIKEVIIYFCHSSSINPSQNMLEESEVRDFVFGYKLLKWKNDFGVRKELVARVLVELYPHILGNPLEKSKGLMESNILDFCDKVAFVRGCPGWEELKTSAKMLVQKNAISVDPDRAPERLMSIIKNLWRTKKEQKIVTGSEFKNSFAEVLTGQKINNAVALRFNLSGPVSDFVGRESQLGEMLQTLKVGTSGFRVRSCTKLVLSGLGGMGKSELAREYCRRHFISLYDNLLWINAENAEAIGISFKTLAFQELGIEAKTSCGKLKDLFTVVKETIDKLKDQPTLFIYDNAESLQKIKKYLPCDAMDGDHILHVIITSRFQDWEGFPVILLDSFQPEEALDVVKRSLGHLPCWKEDDGLALSKELGYYPLALKQAVSHIHEQILHKDHKGRKGEESLLIPEYLKLLKESAELVLDHPFRGREGGYAETTFKTLMSTIDHLRKSLTGQIAITFLNIASYLFPENIDIDSMSSADPKYSREVVERSFRLLSKLSVMSVDGSKARVHRLIQSVNSTRLREEGAEMNVLRSAMNFARAMGCQHVISVWESLKEYPELVGEYKLTPGDVCEMLVCEGNCETVLSFSESALPVLKTHLGKHSEEVMKVEMHVAQSYLSLGKFDEAERFLKKYLFKWKKTSMYYHELYCIGLFLYGCLLETLLRFDEALDVYKEMSSKEIASPLSLSMSKLKITSLMLKKGVQDEEEWMDLELSSRSSYETIRAQVEMVGLEPDWYAPFSVRVNHRNISKALFGYYNGVKADDILMVFLCFQCLPEKTGKWEEAYKVCKWCMDVLSKDGKQCQFFVLRGRLKLAMMLEQLENLHYVYNELMELSSKLNVDHSEEAYSVVNMMLGRVLCLLGRFDEGIPKLVGSCFNRSHDAIQEPGLSGFLFTVNKLSASGSFKRVPCIVDKLLSEMLENVGEKGIPLHFLDKCISVCHKLYVEHSVKCEAVNLLKRIYQFLKIKVGEGHPATLHAKIMFARFYIWFGKRKTVMKGISYLQEARELLLLLIHAGELPLLGLLKAVESDLSICSLCIKNMKSENFKKFSVLPFGKICANCSVKVFPAS